MRRRLDVYLWLSVALVACAAAACGRQPDSPPTTRGQTSNETPPRVIDARFTCGDFDVRVRFESERAVLDLDGRTLVLPQTISASGARYAEGTTVFWNKGREATFNLDGREYACRELFDPWRDAAARGVEFRAIGQEPGWFLEIDEAGALHLEYDYGAERIDAPAARTSDSAGTTTYRSTSGRDVVATVEPRACADAMSGQPFPSTVIVTIAALPESTDTARELRGCGRTLADDPQWRVSGDRIGPVQVGMTIDAAAAALGSPFAPSPDRGECIYRQHPSAPAGVLFMQIGNDVARVDVTSFGVRTDRDVGVGDPESRVRDAYGPDVVSSPHKYDPNGRYLTVSTGDSHRIVFETDGMWITRYRIGRLPEVEWVEGCS